jgi:phosphoglycolate phosphatase-like HAD superfamily hydrolase
MSDADLTSGMSSDAGRPETKKPPSEFALAAAKLDSWTPTDESEYPKILQIVQRSLDTTTKLTEYEDGKAARVLTAMAFVSGLSVAIHNLTVNQIGPDSPELTKVIHTVYLLYYTAVIIGSMFLLYAIFPRFNIPKRDQSYPFSLTFSPEIVRVKLNDWVEQFSSRSAPQLQLRAIRNEILEARLVAEKCAWKVARLKVGMGFYLAGMCVFVAALGTSSYSLVLHSKTKVKPSQTLLIVDADNTLWGTNDVYTNAQSVLIEAVARAVGVPVPGTPVSYVRAVEEDLAASGRGFNLPADLVANTLAKKLITPSAGRNVPAISVGARADIAKAAVEFERALRVSPVLFSGVPETLRRLKNQGFRIVLFSESDPVLLEDRLQRYDLKKYFERIFNGPKSVLAFHEIGNEYREIVGKNVVSIGDRLDVDVQYPMQAGFKSVWIPASFKPKTANVAVTPNLSLTALSDLPERLPAVLNK